MDTDYQDVGHTCHPTLIGCDKDRCPGQADFRCPPEAGVGFQVVEIAGSLIATRRITSSGLGGPVIKDVRRLATPRAFSAAAGSITPIRGDASAIKCGACGAESLARDQLENRMAAG